MPSTAPYSNPCLVAIILVIQSRSGPRLVFHYPPDPLSNETSRTQERGDDSTSTGELSSSDTDDVTNSTEDDEILTRKGSKKGPNSKYAPSMRAHLADEDNDDASGAENANRQDKEWQPSYDPLFGLDGLVT